MYSFDSILIPLFSTENTKNHLELALWLANQSKAKLYILSQQTQFGQVQADVDQLKEKYPQVSAIYINKVHKSHPQEILSTIGKFSSSLLIIPLLSPSSETDELLNEDIRVILEQSPIPVLLIPQSCQAVFPWRSIFVPMSDEAETNEALHLAIDLANTVDVPVDILHVVDAKHKEASDQSTVAYYTDQAHHEYPAMVEEFISQASPFSSAEERKCIRNFRLYNGDTKTKLLKQIEDRRPDLTIVKWRGTLLKGHAEILKEIINKICTPILLVKENKKPQFLLKVGKDLPSDAEYNSSEISE